MQLCIMQFIHNNEQMDGHPNLYIAFRILITVPVSVAAGERSFSKLKLIKTYLRSTMNQERLTGLLSIEQGVASSLSYDNNFIITEFAIRKKEKIILRSVATYINNKVNLDCWNSAILRFSFELIITALMS